MRGDGFTIKTITPEKHLMRWREEGHSRQKYFYGTRAEAEQVKQAALLANGRAKRQEHTFDEVCNLWLELNAHTKSFRDRKNMVARLQEEFAGWRLTQFTTLAIERYRGKCRGAGNKPGTVQLKSIILTSLLRCAVKWKMCSRDLLNELADLEKIKVDNSKTRYLSDDEIEKLLKECRSSRNNELFNIVQVALNTGMRLSEITGLKWERIDLKGREITLNDTKNGKSRYIPINDSLLAIFHGMKVRRIDGRVFGRFGRISFEYACSRSGLGDDFSFHCLRHTFASRMRMKGCSLEVLQRLLGHSSLTMTLRYAHIGESEAQDAVRLLDERSAVNG